MLCLDLTGIVDSGMTHRARLLLLGLFYLLQLITMVLGVWLIFEFDPKVAFAEANGEDLVASSLQMNVSLARSAASIALLSCILVFSATWGMRRAAK